MGGRQAAEPQRPEAAGEGSLPCDAPPGGGGPGVHRWPTPLVPTTGAALAGIINVHPWFAPQYAIPLLGMVLGNLLTGVSLALDRFMHGIAREAGVIESDLALGATRWEAARPLISDALRTGMVPTINAMMVMGVVSLPGMMTGQMLAGAAPTAAVRYQIVIMFMIAAATALGTLGVILLAYLRLFNRHHQLCATRVQSVGQSRG